MNKDILAAYEYLVPTDQLIIDSMIIALYNKDKKIKQLTDHILQTLSDESQELNDEKEN